MKLFMAVGSGRLFFGKEEMCMKKILLVAGALASVSAAVFCVLRRRKKHYGSPC